MSGARVLVVDDEPAIRSALTLNLGRAGYQITTAPDLRAARDALRESPPDLVLTDVKMPDGLGTDLLDQVRRDLPDVPVVIMTGFGSVEDAVRAMKAGAADYLIKPIAKDELLLVLQRALEVRSLRAEVVALRREVNDRYGFEQMIGSTPVMQALYDEITAVAPSQATVLLRGPTGSGKELAAHALHARSARAGGPFVRVNCGAIPTALFESELFGHERGAFTGAVRQHVGSFEAADGGSIFLDEVGELEATAQVKLLRVLESREIQRVGATTTRVVDVRVVAATHRDLDAMVAAGTFREDLYYRLNVVALDVPPLDARKDDIPLLVEHFLRRLAAREGRVPPRLRPESLERLTEAAWPGNVRQLQHAVERAVVLHRDGEWLTIEPPASATTLTPAPALAPAVTSLGDALDAYERQLILDALRAEGGVQARAARRLGVSKSNFGYRLQRLGLRDS